MNESTAAEILRAYQAKNGSKGGGVNTRKQKAARRQSIAVINRKKKQRARNPKAQAKRAARKLCRQEKARRNRK